jgi:hypothetical protein
MTGMVSREDKKRERKKRKEKDVISIYKKRNRNEIMATAATRNIGASIHALQSKETRFLYLVITLYESKTYSVKISKREKMERKRFFETKNRMMRCVENNQFVIDRSISPYHRTIP